MNLLPRKTYCIAPFALGLLFGLSTAFAQMQLPEKVAIAKYTDTAPEIDGLVDEVWLQITPQDSFIQREPYQGDLSTAQTKFYILHDDHHLYLLFIMLDDDAKSIPSRLLERDQEFHPDDHVSFYLDTYNDLRRAYLFSTNPAGIERDALISENGSKIDYTWDGIFNVAARRNNYGWVAEFAIPFTTLRFTDELRYQIWGFNVWRIRKKYREISYWSLVSQDYHLVQLDQGGALVGMRDLHSGHHLELLPYVTARNITQPSGKENDLDPGIDIKYGLTSDLTLDATINPDFGQVEIDEEQINVDKRYEIVLAEKRPFFLENTNLFQTPFYQMFYSRRIGAQSDIKAGAKLTGKLGSYSIGALGAYTGGWDRYKGIPGLGDPNTLPDDELFSVLRLQGDILASSNLGVMYIDRATNLGGTDRVANRAAGIDLTLRSGQFHMLGQGVYTHNSNKNSTLSGSGIYAQAGYYGSIFRIDPYISTYSPDFNLDSLGYFPKIPEKGSTQMGVYTDIHPLINYSYIRSWGIGLHPILRKDSDEEEYGAGMTFIGWVEFKDQSRIKMGYTRYRDTEDDKFYSFFRPFKKTDLTYWGNQFYVQLDSDISQPVSLRLRVDGDKQYYFQTHTIGFNRGFSGFITIKPRSNLYFEAGYQNRHFLDDGGNYMPNDLVGQSNARIWSFRGRYLFTKNIFSRLFFQHTNGAEDFIFTNHILQYEVWKRLSGNILFGWRFRPGSTMYLAYTEEWDQRSTDDFLSINRILFLKLSYLWSY
jgi:hypothetical protein